jgi:hypothetical protein
MLKVPNSNKLWIITSVRNKQEIIFMKSNALNVVVFRHIYSKRLNISYSGSALKIS